jgi:hypothetical protein
MRNDSMNALGHPIARLVIEWRAHLDHSVGWQRPRDDLGAGFSA